MLPQYDPCKRAWQTLLWCNAKTYKPIKLNKLNGDLSLLIQICIYVYLTYRYICMYVFDFIFGLCTLFIDKVMVANLQTCMLQVITENVSQQY